MGFFSNLFNSGRKRKGVNALVSDMCDGLVEVRQSWFNSCVESLRLELAQQKDVTILHARLEGNADCAIRAFQFYLITDFLGNHSYMTPQETKGFAVLLGQQVFGTKLKECKIYWNRYNDAEGGQQANRFCDDIAKYITGIDSPLAETMFLFTRCFPQFFTITQISVANTFGDNKMVKALEDNFRKVAEKAVRDWKDNIAPMMHELYKDEK